MKLAKLFAATALALGSSLAALPAMAQAITPLCSLQAEPTISFVEFPAPNLVLNASGQIVQNGTLTIKGKMRVPNCYGPVSKPGNKLPTVLIMHGSGGVDSRGDFHAQALNAAGFATLEIDMWEARGVTGVANRPALPIARPCPPSPFRMPITPCVSCPPRATSTSTGSAFWAFPGAA